MYRVGILKHSLCTYRQVITHPSWWCLGLIVFWVGASVGVHMHSCQHASYKAKKLRPLMPRGNALLPSFSPTIMALTNVQNLGIAIAIGFLASWLPWCPSWSSHSSTGGSCLYTFQPISHPSPCQITRRASPTHLSSAVTGPTIVAGEAGSFTDNHSMRRLSRRWWESTTPSTNGLMTIRTHFKLRPVTIIFRCATSRNPFSTRTGL